MEDEEIDQQREVPHYYILLISKDSFSSSHKILIATTIQESGLFSCQANKQTSIQVKYEKKKYSVDKKRSN